MDFAISAIRPPTLPELPTAASKVQGSGDFANILNSAINQSEGLRQDSNVAVQQFLAGENEDPHKMIMTMQRADLAFEMLVQTRNKVTQAYQEIMRMQL